MLMLLLLLSAGRPGLRHRGAGVGEAARLLLVARAHRVLVDDGPEPGRRRHPLGHVVRGREVLRGE